MKIFDRNSEFHLYEMAKTLRGQPHASWRCIHMRLSDRYSYLLKNHFMASMVTQRLTDAEGYIYLCGDGDVIILFQGQLRHVLGRLGAHVDGLKHEQLLKVSDENPFLIYDLGSQWEHFYYLCRTKCFRAEIDRPATVFPGAYAVASQRPALMAE